jgi:serine/threonine protein kinase
VVRVPASLPRRRLAFEATVEFVVHLDRLTWFGDRVECLLSETVRELKLQFFGRRRGRENPADFDICRFGDELELISLAATAPLASFSPDEPLVAVRVSAAGEPADEALAVGDARVIVARNRRSRPFMQLEDQRRPSAFRTDSKAVLTDTNEICNLVEVRCSGPAQLDRLTHQMELLCTITLPSVLLYHQAYWDEPTAMFGMLSENVQCHTVQLSDLITWTPTRKHITLLGIAKTIELLHARGVVIGRLSWDAVMFKGEEFEPVLFVTDDRFPLLAGDSLAADSSQYQAPEVFRGEIQGPEADIWAFGILVCELILGAKLSRHQAELIRKGRQLEIPGEVYQSVIAGCIRVNSKERITAADLVRALAAVGLSREPTVQRYLGLFKPESPRPRAVPPSPPPAVHEGQWIDRIDLDQDYVRKRRLDANIYEFAQKATEKQFIVKSIAAADQRECEEYRRIQNHSFPSIVNYVGINEIGRSVYLLREYVARGSLHDWVMEQRQVTRTAKHIIALGVAKALEHMHAKSMSHGNLRPSNILLRDNLEPVVVGFGVSATARDRQDLDSRVRGESLLFCAPEVIEEEVFTPAGDIFAFGMVIYFMVIEGVPGIPEDMLREFIVKGKRPNISVMFDDIYRDIVARCWDQDARKRPLAREVVKQLKDVSFARVIDREKFADYLKQFGDALPPGWNR